jgi:hypothetical protein
VVHTIAPIVCACGQSHTDCSALEKRGWHPDGKGNAVLLCNCTCRSSLTVAVAVDATVCTVCRRLVTGSAGDVKVCVGHRSIVLCLACFRRHPKHDEWLAWTTGGP